MKRSSILTSKILCATFIILFFIEVAYSQNVKLNIKGNKTERKAEKSEYVVHDQGDTQVIYNKQNSLMIYNSSYVDKLGYLDNDYVVKFSNRAQVDNLVYKNIAPFLRNFKGKYVDNISSFEVNLYAKPDGKICELSFSMDKDTNIPLNALEKLEQHILVLGLKLEFDPTSDYVRDALWVCFPIEYSVKKMKAKLRENGN